MIRLFSAPGHRAGSQNSGGLAGLVWRRLGSALVGVMTLTGPLAAATLVQTVSFEADSFVPFLETSVPIAIAIPNSGSDTYSDMEEFTETFDRFDTSLGTLTSVSWHFDIQATLEGDSLYGCVGLFSITCSMETTLQTDLTAVALATVRGEEIITIPLPGGDVVELNFPQQSIITPDSVALSETETPSPSGLVGCVVRDVLNFDETCRGGTLQEAENQQTITDAPLDAYTNGDIELDFRVVVEGSIDTTCQLFGVVGACYSRNFPDASASLFASLTYHYTPFADPEPPVAPPPAVPLPAGFPLLVGAMAVLGLIKRRQALP